MSTDGNAMENTFPREGNDILRRLTKMASKVQTEALGAKDAVYNTLKHQGEFATETLNKAGREATRLSRRYPIQMIAAALALGFLIGRRRR